MLDRVKMYDFRSSPMLRAARDARFKPSLWLQILLFFVVFTFGSFVAELPATVYLFATSFPIIYEKVEQMWESAGEVAIDSKELVSLMEELAQERGYLLCTLFGTALCIALTVCYVRLIEKRSLFSMGFTRKGAVGKYVFGLLLGTGLFSAAIGISVASGAMSLSASSSVSWLYVVLFFFAFLFQGMEEEVLLRGYLMVSLTNSAGIFTAVISSSLLFALLHGANPGVGALALVNLFLFGLFAALFFLRTGNIWAVSALHTAWNFAQGNLYGCPVSGMNGLDSILHTTLDTSKTIVNGGAFGPEGGLPVTIVLLLALAAVLFLPSRTGADISQPTGGPSA